jgi:hypothetical protein
MAEYFPDSANTSASAGVLQGLEDNFLQDRNRDHEKRFIFSIGLEPAKPRAFPGSPKTSPSHRAPRPEADQREKICPVTARCSDINVLNRFRVFLNELKP